MTHAPTTHLKSTTATATYPSDFANKPTRQPPLNSRVRVPQIPSTALPRLSRARTSSPPSPCEMSPRARREHLPRPVLATPPVSPTSSRPTSAAGTATSASRPFSAPSTHLQARTSSPNRRTMGRSPRASGSQSAPRQTIRGSASPGHDGPISLLWLDARFRTEARGRSRACPWRRRPRGPCRGRRRSRRGRSGARGRRVRRHGSRGRSGA